MAGAAKKFFSLVASEVWAEVTIGLRDRKEEIEPPDAREGREGVGVGDDHAG